ncbi:ribosome-associated translation inhibitor RaiA [Brachyspira intermedia]|uniref:ribosome hibernation-promoting factor, HPF/YfiA family n=1 Tax=Brachyspira intermedia TaxID=84377 RepID=UPI00300774F1
MHQNIIGKNVRITKNVREHIANKMQNIKIHADRIIDANIICDYMHGEYTVQGTIAFGKKVFHDKEKERDLYVAIDAMFQKIEREIRKSKERNIDRSQRAVVDKSVQTEDDDDAYSINSVGIYEKPLDELDAVLHFNSDKKPYMAYLPIKQGEDLFSIKIGKFPVFLFKGNDNKVLEVYNKDEEYWNIDEVSVTPDNHIDASKSENYLIKEYNVSEAVNYLTENTDKKFVVYISSITEQAEALYKESDNSFVLIRMFDI